MILDTQTNVCYLSKRLIKRENGRNIVDQIMNHGVKINLLTMTCDIWARDYMPIQINDSCFIGYDYAPDYLYNPQYINTITNQTRVCNELKLETIPSGLILDGGNIVKTSRGAIMVDKVFKENRRYSRINLINRLENLLQCEIIFLPWDRSEIYGHADGIVREITPGKVLLTDYSRYSKRYAKFFEDILSRHFEVILLDLNLDKPHPNSWCYINYLQIGNKIFLPQLTSFRREIFNNPTSKTETDYRLIRIGKVIEEDEIALEKFHQIFPKQNIIPISCPEIVKAGGALNCISWNIKSTIDNPTV